VLVSIILIVDQHTRIYSLNMKINAFESNTQKPGVHTCFKIKPELGYNLEIILRND